MQLMYITLACACLGMVVALQRVSCRSRLWLSAFLTFLAAYLGLILLDAQAFHISPKLYFLLLSIVFLPGPCCWVTWGIFLLVAMWGPKTLYCAHCLC